MKSFEPQRMILVVESYDDMREALCALLRQEGHLVTSAASAEKALAALGLFESIGLILIDLKLPGLSGAEFLSKLRSRPYFNRVAVIAMTTADEVQLAGAEGCLRKPFTREELMEFVWKYSGNPNGSVASYRVVD